MKINPQIAKTPDELSNLAFKKAKSLLKRDLKRLEQGTSPENPIPIMVWGDFAYADKPNGAGMLLVGKWQGDFKRFAKQEVATQMPLAAIGQAYFAGVDNLTGQKIVHLELSKGKGKSKTDKIAKGLRKLIPQATIELVFGELSEAALDALEQRWDAQPDDALEPELAEALQDDGGELELDANADVQLLLNSNLLRISETLNTVKMTILPRLVRPESDDATTVEDLLDLCAEWLEIYNEAPSLDIQERNRNACLKVQEIRSKAEQILAKLQLANDPQPLAVGKSAPETSPVSTTQQRLAQGETLGITDTETLRQMFVSSQNQRDENGQQLIGICDKASRAMVYKYLDQIGLVDEHVRLNNDITDDIDVNSPYYIGMVWDGKGTGNIALIDREETTAGGLHYVPNMQTFEKAIRYIDYHLGQTPPIPVVAGVSYKDDKYNIDKTTDHFIVLVAMREQGGRKVYQYLEPGTSHVDLKGINVKANELVQNPDKPYQFWDSKIGIGNEGDQFILTNVVLYQKDRGNDAWEKAAETPTPALQPQAIQFQFKGSAIPLKPHAEAILRELFARAGEAQPVVISTYRSETEQANILFDNLERYGAAFNRQAYRNKAAAAQIIDAYEAAKAAGKTAEELRGIVFAALKNVGAAAISAHCDAANPAIDILPQSIRNKARFEQVLKSDGRVQVICPPKDVSYHIVIK